MPRKQTDPTAAATAEPQPPVETPTATGDTPATPAETTTAVADAATPKTPAVEIVRGEREFHVSGSVVKENETTAGLTNEQARDALKAAFPEVANATIRERNEGGVSIVEFLPQPGRKG